MSPTLQRRLLTVAAVLGLAGLGLMIWALFTSSPLVLMTSMSLGQASGTVSFGLYLAVVVADLWHARLPAEGQADAPPGPQAQQQDGEP